MKPYTKNTNYQGMLKVVEIVFPREELMRLLSNIKCLVLKHTQVSLRK